MQGIKSKTMNKKCPLCNNSALVGYIQDSDEILECECCGCEWEQSSGTITLNPKELS